MFTQERHAAILRIVSERGAATVSDLVEELHSSESTIRRDLSTLDDQRLLHKVHGGATALESPTVQFTREEYGVDYKYEQNTEEKKRIARRAASLITKNDFVFLDAGTSIEGMVDYLECKEAVYVTTGILLARKLARSGFQVYVPAGRIKPVTEAIVGGESLQALARYNFTLGFFGTNGITLREGFTTPDIEEARTKTAALQRCKRRLVLADHSKFDNASAVTFASLRDAEIITGSLPDAQYRNYTKITEVDKP